MRELLLEIWTSVRRNKLRTFLTGFSVAWGIFMLVILLGSGNGLKNGVTSNFGNYATNSINLYGGRTSKPYMGYQKGRRIRLWNSDLEILAQEFPEVDEVAANSWFDNHTATYGNEYTEGLAARLAAQDRTDRGRGDREGALRQRRRHPRIPQVAGHRPGHAVPAIQGRRSAGGKDQARQQRYSPWSASTKATPSAAVRRVTSR